ncbi:tumor necrosis factor receptor superfamily member 11A isoform X2 [Girardinichthys multiradiatus]|uniref:tumor necrosis factor receptor superfamily member 11A isoform X2 n=1 Tax=Girardinichthys multiradiatus TaxID=208333 RepID=UPI001FAD6273|nr:tumor necrosis factor receptor superfamily member 11A isoform X2 [Girardinichthys multiradiatus]
MWWVFRGWITCVLVTFSAQDAISKSTQCKENYYLNDSTCCKKCPAGQRVLSHCSEYQDTVCIQCSHDTYQPGWTGYMTCIKKKYCDPGKGFLRRNEHSEDPKREEQCQCRPGFQCSLINCEYCEKIPTCGPGWGLEEDPASKNGRKICVGCKNGFYSAEEDQEQCKEWTNCKAEGKSEKQRGSAQADAECGPPVFGPAPSWFVVSLLSVVTVLCLLILLLFCYKDKLKLLSVNLRSCVQNLKRSRIQQETLAPLYRSGAAGGGIPEVAGSKCTPCEMTELIYPASPSPEIDPPCTFPASVPCVMISLPFTEEMAEKEVVKENKVTETESRGSGEPEELSEEEVINASPFLASSCVCVSLVREPLEVGENEDCSQAVIPGTTGTCSCGGLEVKKDGEENVKEDKSDNQLPEERVDQEKMGTSLNETSVRSLVSVCPPVHTSSLVLPSNPLPDLCLPLSQAQSTQSRSTLSDKSLVKQDELYRLASTESDSSENNEASAMTLVSAVMMSTSAGELYLDKTQEASRLEHGQGIFCGNSKENKLSLEESELECSPESLHSELAEPTLTSGLISGSHNTTFISSGQVMNVTGDVIVVYVSQMSDSSDEGGPDGAFGSPVQEEANETAQFFQSCLRSQGVSISHSTLREKTLPVQEMILGK